MASKVFKGALGTVGVLSPEIIVPHPDENACGACISAYMCACMNVKFGGLKIWSPCLYSHYTIHTETV